MATDVIMPALGIAQETGKLLQWLKNEGETVTKGDILMVVETDKASVEIEAPATGTLSQVTAQVGDEVPVGHTIALILAPGEAAPPRAGEGEKGREGVKEKAPEAPPPPPTPSPPPAPVPAHVTASPLARRIAEENHIDLSQVRPSGDRIEKADVLAYIESLKTNSAAPSPGTPDGGRGEGLPPSPGTPGEGRGEGRLTPASPKARKAAADAQLDIGALQGSGPSGAVLYGDVTKAAQAGRAKPTPPAPVKAPASAPTTGAVPGAEKVGTIWRIMAERTTQSWTSVPHFYLTREVNAKRLMTWRERALKRSGTSSAKITYTDLLVRLVAAALREHPRVNVSWKDGSLLRHPEINIGLAAAVEDGLVVPVIHQADKLSITELAQQRAELVARAQANRLKPEDISGGTFTVTNLGMYGIDVFHAIVNPPQAAILAVGRIVERVTPVEGQPAVQPMMTLTLSCDHRAVDGARGAQFLQTLAEMIEEPLGLLD